MNEIALQLTRDKRRLLLPRQYDAHVTLRMRGIPGYGNRAIGNAWPLQALPLLILLFAAKGCTLKPADELRPTFAKAESLLKARGEEAIPSPSDIDARFPQLLDHQAEYVVEAGATRGFGFYMEPGLGKTFAALAYLDWFLKPEDGHRIAVVAAPVTLIDAAWKEDAEKFLPGLPCVSLQGTPKGCRREALEGAVAEYGRVVALVSWDTLQRTLKDEPWFLQGAIFVGDESQRLKNNKTNTSKFLAAVAPSCRRVLLLSGTPAPNGLIEHWTASKVLSGVNEKHDPFEGTRKWFEDRWVMQVGPYKRIVPSGKTQAFMERMRKVARFMKRSEVHDIPCQEVTVPLQADATTYKLAKGVADHFARMADDDWATRQLFMRLRQVHAGIIPRGVFDFCDREVSETQAGGIDADTAIFNEKSPRLAWLQEFIAGLPEGERVLLWTNWHAELDGYREWLTSSKLPFGVLDGRVPSSERRQIIRNFRDGHTRILLANPQCVAHGITLVECRYAVFLSTSFSAEHYRQACDRLIRIGQERDVITYRLAVQTGLELEIDRRVLDVVDGKLNVSAIAQEHLRGRAAV